jgi:hypothetical protein
MNEIPNASFTQHYKLARVIAGVIRVEVLDESEAKGDEELLNLPCGRGARTPVQNQVVKEVMGGLNATFAGNAGPVKVVKVREDGGGLIGAAAVCMTGDHQCERHLTTEPYIEAIGRHDNYYRYVLRDCRAGTVTAGAILLRATVEMVMQERPTGFIVARVRVGNDPSQKIFDDEHFDRLPREAFSPPTVQMIRRRSPTVANPPHLPLEIYVPPRRLILPSSRYEHSLAA